MLSPWFPTLPTARHMLPLAQHSNPQFIKIKTTQQQFDAKDIGFVPQYEAREPLAFELSLRAAVELESS